MPLIACPDCGKEISSEAVACIGCGRPMPSSTPAKPHGPRPALATRRFSVKPLHGALLVAAILAIPFAAMLLTYGTVSPCEALKAEARSQIYRDVGPAPGGPLTVVAGTHLVNAMIEAQVVGYGHVDCWSGLIKLRFGP